MRQHFLRIFTVLSIIVVAFCAAAVVKEQSPQKTTAQRKEAPLSNNDVVELTSAKIPAEIIVQKIEQAEEVTFDVSTQAMVSLKGAGVGDAVIKAMLSRMNKAGAARTDAKLATQPSQAPSESEGRIARLKSRMKLGRGHDSADPVAKKPPETVKLFLAEKPSDRYRELGRVDAGKFNFAGISRGRETVNAELQKKAADLGADAIINITEDFASVSGVAIAFDRPQH